MTHGMIFGSIAEVVGYRDKLSESLNSLERVFAVLHSWGFGISHIELINQTGISVRFSRISKGRRELPMFVWGGRHVATEFFDDYYSANRNVQDITHDMRKDHYSLVDFLKRAITAWEGYENDMDNV